MNVTVSDRMKKWILVGAGLAMFLIIRALMLRLEQRPYAPVELAANNASLESGDTYSFTWKASESGPDAEFYYLEQANPTFTAPIRRKYAHVGKQSDQQSSATFVAPDVGGPTTTRQIQVLAGYIGKSGEVLSNPSNVVKILIKPLPDPTILPITDVFSGQEYTVSWTPVSKANAYELEEQQPNMATQTTKLLATSKPQVAPPLSQDGTASFQVRAAVAQGSKWTYITGFSNKVNVTIKHVAPPPNLKVQPASAHHPQKFTVSWDPPLNGPKPTISYSYELKQSQSPTTVQQTQTSYTATAPLVASTNTISFEVRAKLGANPMTLFSAAPVTVTIKKPPPPPAPSITKIDPKLAEKGAGVTITGKNLTGAKVELLSPPSKSVMATPTSHTATKIVFKVPTGASLKTTHVRATVGTQSIKKPFTVARKPGKFADRQSSIKWLDQSCGQFKADVDLPPKYLGRFTGRFTKGTKVLKYFPQPGFRGDVNTSIKTGFGFSKGCKVGVVVYEDKPPAPLYEAHVLFYNLDLTQDATTKPGDKISGPHGIKPHPDPLWKEGYKLLFSPDDTIAAVVHRDSLVTTKTKIYMVDMLKGSGTLYSTSFSGSLFTLSVKDNKIAFKPGNASTAMIPIP